VLSISAVVVLCSSTALAIAEVATSMVVIKGFLPTDIANGRNPYLRSRPLIGHEREHHRILDRARE
jgi:hypothetical protein